MFISLVLCKLFVFQNLQLFVFVNKSEFVSAGGPPIVIANGGYSGIFPDSSQYAYSFAMEMSLPDAAMYCNVQLTRDNLGVCAPTLNIALSTTAAMAYPKGEKTFNVDGQDTRGWYSMDYNLEDLKNTTFCKFCSND